MFKNRRLLATIIFVLLIAVLLIVILFIVNKTTRIEYYMNAALVNSDGAVIDTFALTIDGTVREKESSCYLDLAFNLPEDFRYSFDNADPNGYICIEHLAFTPGDFVTCGYTDDRLEVGSAWTVWAINTEKEYFVAYWGEDFGQFLVASTNPDVNPSDILDHFQEFLNLYGTLIN